MVIGTTYLLAKLEPMRTKFNVETPGIDRECPRDRIFQKSFQGRSWQPCQRKWVEKEEDTTRGDTEGGGVVGGESDREQAAIHGVMFRAGFGKSGET